MKTVKFTIIVLIFIVLYFIPSGLVTMTISVTDHTLAYITVFYCAVLFGVLATTVSNFFSKWFDSKLEH